MPEWQNHCLVYYVSTAGNGSSAGGADPRPLPTLEDALQEVRRRPGDLFTAANAQQTTAAIEITCQQRGAAVRKRHRPHHQFFVDATGSGGGDGTELAPGRESTPQRKA